MIKPIAVVTDNISETFQWLKREHGIDEINVTHRTAANSKTGQRYVLIINKEQTYAWEFSGMLVSPFYESLAQVVRSRIK